MATATVDFTSFSEPPPGSVLKHLIDVYCLNCQNQPYCFVHEPSLRRRLLNDEVPQYLLLALAASSARYSKHDWYKHNPMAAVEAYARAAWAILLERFFASNHCSDVSMAQATALLAIIDFT
ncbi:hypothetical protein LTR53_002897, partial [Teratosphaeriaceae sp. CCFEE 6253]